VLQLDFRDACTIGSGGRLSTVEWELEAGAREVGAYADVPLVDACRGVVAMSLDIVTMRVRCGSVVDRR
jgi:hypothetical protein